MARGHIVLCLLAVALGVAYADEPEKLVSGIDAYAGEFPYMVSMRLHGSHICGGAIVSRSHIITAGHCVMAIQPSEYKDVTIVSATNSLRQGGESHKVAFMSKHPLYQGGWYSDIGVIKLLRPMTFNRFQNAIPIVSQKPPTNIVATVSAWGMMGLHRGISQNLQKLNLRTISKAECKSYHGSAIHDNMICTLNKVDVGTCSGDSGSPLVYRGELIGVVSGGIPCATGVPDVFTSVYETLSYVNQQIY